MKKQYDKNCVILEENLGFTDCLKSSEIELIYGKEYYEKFYTFCQENLEIQEKKFGIKLVVVGRNSGHLRFKDF